MNKADGDMIKLYGVTYGPEVGVLLKGLHIINMISKNVML